MKHGNKGDRSSGCWTVSLAEGAGLGHLRVERGALDLLSIKYQVRVCVCMGSGGLPQSVASEAVGFCHERWSWHCHLQVRHRRGSSTSSACIFRSHKWNPLGPPSRRTLSGTFIDQDPFSRSSTCCTPCWGFQSRCLNVDSCLERGVKHQLASLPLLSHCLPSSSRKALGRQSKLQLLLWGS